MLLPNWVFNLGGGGSSVAAFVSLRSCCFMLYDACLRFLVSGVGHIAAE